MNYSIVNCYQSIRDFVNLVQNSNFSEYSVDLEGQLHRDGHIDYITIYIPKEDLTFIFDCNELSHGQIKHALNRILNNDSIIKYVFDCRSDSDALYHLYDIMLLNVIDVQLYEIGYRKCKGKRNVERYMSLFDTLRAYKERIDITTGQLELKKRFSII